MSLLWAYHAAIYIHGVGEFTLDSEFRNPNPFRDFRVYKTYSKIRWLPVSLSLTLRSQMAIRLHAYLVSLGVFWIFIPSSLHVGKWVLTQSSFLYVWKIGFRFLGFVFKIVGSGTHSRITMHKLVRGWLTFLYCEPRFLNLLLGPLGRIVCTELFWLIVASPF